MLPENQPTLVAWASEAQALLQEHVALQRPFFEASEKWAARTEQLIGHLAIRCTMTSDSLLLLVGQLKFWDGEVLARVALEGTLKLFYATAGTPEMREQRTIEFLDRLTDLASWRRQRRLERFFSIIQDGDSERWQGLREALLTEQELERLRERLRDIDRGDLEKRWSQSGLMEELARSGDFEGAVGLLHSYGMSSHLAHIDGDAVLLIAERERRSHQRVAAIELAHGARLMSDVLSYSELRTAVMLRAKHLDLTALTAARARMRPLEAEFRQADEAWRNIEFREGASRAQTFSVEASEHKTQTE